jgi:antitoxin component of RelBE/YafQ-DinJ toxin-antitoxin module
MPIVPLTAVYLRNYSGLDKNRPRDTQQIRDGISCGSSAAIYAEYVIIHGNFLASREDFSYDHIYDLCMYLVETFLQYFLNQGFNDRSIPLDLRNDSDDFFGEEDSELMRDMKASLQAEERSKAFQKSVENFYPYRRTKNEPAVKNKIFRLGLLIMTLI